MVARGDQVEYFNDIHKVVISGRVQATYSTSTLTCDHATIYTETKDAYLKGHVTLVQPEGILRGEDVLYNYETQKGIVLQSETEEGEWRTKADRAEKISDTAVAQRDGYLTSCDFEEPHTRFQAKEVNVYLNDRVVLKNVVMYLGKTPVFYLPSYTYLLDDKRPRVSLIPGKTKSWGYFLLTSWRLYITESLQGRVLVDSRDRLGLAYGEELKYDFPLVGQGILRSYYADERKVLHQNHFYKRYFKPENKTTLNKARKRFQVRDKLDLDKDTHVTFEAYHQSDPLVVFDYFLREYEVNPTPQSYLNIVRESSWYGLTLSVTKRLNKFETVTQQWPSIAMNIRPILIPWLPDFEQLLRGLKHDPGLGPGARGGLYYQSDYSYAHTNVSGPKNSAGDSIVRFDTIQQIFYPLRLFSLFNFRPFFKFHNTDLARGASQPGPLDRQAAEAGFDLNTKFFRTFLAETDFLGLDIHQLRHIITPTLSYDYQAKPTPLVDRFLQNDLNRNSSLSLGMEHKLQTKRSENGNLRAVDLARFTSTIPYAIIQPDGRHKGLWGNMALDVETKLYSWLYTESDASIDPHIGKILTLNADMVIQPGLGSGLSGPSVGTVFNKDFGQLKELPWAVGLGWRYVRRTSGQLVLETEFDLGPKWRMGIYQGFDVKRFITESTVFGDQIVKKIYDIPELEYRIRRDLHEWTVELVVNKLRGQGQSIFCVFRLKAAPGMPLDFQRHYHQPKAGRNFPKPGEVYGGNISPLPSQGG